MLPNPKFLQSCPQLLYPPSAAAPLPQLHNIPASPCFPILKQLKLSRRELTICGNSSLLLVLGSQALELLYPSKAQAEENPPYNNQQEENVTTPSPNCSNKVPKKRAFLDIAIDGEPVGRIVVGLYGDDVPEHDGLRSYGVDAELANRTGSNLAVENLREEWERIYMISVQELRTWLEQ